MSRMPGPRMGEKQAMYSKTAIKNINLNEPQQEAAELFEELARAVYGSPSSGHHIDGQPQERPNASAEDQWRWDSLRNVLAPAIRDELINVLWAGMPARSQRRLEMGLDAVHDWLVT